MYCAGALEITESRLSEFRLLFSMLAVSSWSWSIWNWTCLYIAVVKSKPNKSLLYAIDPPGFKEHHPSASWMYQTWVHVETWPPNWPVAAWRCAVGGGVAVTCHSAGWLVPGSLRYDRRVWDISRYVPDSDYAACDLCASKWRFHFDKFSSGSISQLEIFHACPSLFRGPFWFRGKFFASRFRPCWFNSLAMQVASALSNGLNQRESSGSTWSTGSST